ncbi:MAG: hypothetical protein E7011_02110 [Alphaproteobacteria bacterium]|nr:hypothetical protein [Alphaproteobacteria bacterium]
MKTKSYSQKKRRQAAVDYIFNQPVALLHKLGLTDTSEMHGQWLVDFLRNSSEITIMGHRESFKTSVLCVGLALKLILFPRRNYGFFRKTDEKVREVVRGTQRHLRSLPLVKLSEMIWGFPIVLTRATDTEIDTNYYQPIKGESALYGCGINGSITGKHFNDVTTDDIVDKDDRYSEAERTKTHRFLDELENTLNRGGVRANFCTPWHRNDGTTRFKNVHKYPVGVTGLFTAAQLEQKKRSMAPELYAINYELDLSAANESLFAKITKKDDWNPNGTVFAYLDPSHKGGDYTAFCIGAMCFQRLQITGFVWKKPYYEIFDNGDFLKYCQYFGVSDITIETNGVGDMPVRLARELSNESMGGLVSVRGVHNTMPKIARIQAAAAFCNSVDIVTFDDVAENREFVSQVCDYDASASHDDAPDSVAGLMEAMRLIRVEK